MRKKKFMGHELTENGRSPKKKNVKHHRRAARRSYKNAESTAEFRSCEKEHDAHRKNWNRSFTDKFGGWRGFFKKNVGRPWNDVFSELVARLKGEGAMHRWHALEGHLWHEVELHVEVIDGVAYEKSPNYAWRGKWPIEGCYVHPETGVLSWQEPRKRKRYQRTVDSVTEGDLRYELRKGAWYVWGDGGAIIKTPPYYYGGVYHDRPPETLRPLSPKEVEAFYARYPEAKRV